MRWPCGSPHPIRRPRSHQRPTVRFRLIPAVSLVSGLLIKRFRRPEGTNRPTNIVGGLTAAGRVRRTGLDPDFYHSQTFSPNFTAFTLYLFSARRVVRFVCFASF